MAQEISAETSVGQMAVLFEDCAKWIAFKDVAGKVIMRCKTSATDIGYDESLDDFVVRRGGLKAVFQYAATLRGLLERLGGAA